MTLISKPCLTSASGRPSCGPCAAICWLASRYLRLVLLTQHRGWKRWKTAICKRMGGTVAIQTQCCLMKREEYDEDVSDSERAEEEETKVQAVCALPWNGRPSSPLHGAPPCGTAPQVPRSLSDATTIVPHQRRVEDTVKHLLRHRKAEQSQLTGRKGWRLFQGLGLPEI